VGMGNVTENKVFRTAFPVDMGAFASIAVKPGKPEDEMKMRTFAKLAGPKILDMLKDNDFYQWVGMRVDKDKWIKEYKMNVQAKKNGIAPLLIEGLIELSAQIQDRVLKLSTVKKEEPMARMDIARNFLYMAMVGAYQMIQEGKTDGTADKWIEQIVSSQLSAD